MALTNFNKFVIVKYDTVNYPSDTRNLIQRTFTDAVLDSTGSAFDETQIFVSHNGQRIRQRHAETASTFSRFYYEIVSPTTSQFTIAIKANSAYTNSAYSGGSPINFQIEDNDIFFIDYTYQVNI